MAEPRPALSIVVCSRNGAARLGPLFDSLKRLPPEPPWEAIIVDNGSVDRTRDVILEAARNDARIRYASCPDIGLGSARNAGWKAAGAGLIAFTDDDCSLDPDFVRSLTHVFAEHPQVGFVGGRLVMEGRPDADIINAQDTPRHFAAYGVIAAGHVSGANHAFRREVLERTGGYDPKFGAGTRFPCEDVDAVAAASWAGFGGRFDPRPLIHHHSRCEDDRALSASYDRGRGAYYMKYLLRSDSRWHYARHWIGSTLRHRSPMRALRELAAAAEYLAMRLTMRR